MRENFEAPQANSLQYSIDSLDEFRSTAYQCGIKAMDRAQDRTLTPIFFSSVPSTAAFEAAGAKATSNNYYKIRDAYSKI